MLDFARWIWMAWTWFEYLFFHIDVIRFFGPHVGVEKVLLRWLLQVRYIFIAFVVLYTLADAFFKMQ
ncbi:hypothetical protein PFAS1_14865 [Pseudomonas frederiksbergensis]|nr:hypothetical protein PFAS1_14865 [Pseudomonas frederiksbergensis]